MEFSRRQALMALGTIPFVKNLVSESPYNHRDGLDYILKDGIEYPVLEMHGPCIMNLEKLFDGIEFQLVPSGHWDAQRIKVWLPKANSVADSQSNSLLSGVVLLGRIRIIVLDKTYEVGRPFIAAQPETEKTPLTSENHNMLSKVNNMDYYAKER